MALPTNPTATWTQGLGFPSRLFGTGSDDYELYEEDGEFALSVDLPGFAKSDIDMSWYDGRLNIAAEREDEQRGRRRTYHRSFRFPKEVDVDDITASYSNGVLEVVVPIDETGMAHGETITIE